MVFSLVHLHAPINARLAVSYACLHLSFLYACIDMDSSEVVYLSSDDEPIFDRNQRLIKGHREQEDRHQI